MGVRGGLGANVGGPSQGQDQAADFQSSLPFGWDCGFQHELGAGSLGGWDPDGGGAGALRSGRWEDPGSGDEAPRW